MGKTRIGIVGLGRLGKRHAYNLANLVPGAELAAACSPVQAELDWAGDELGVPHRFEHFDDMLERADIDAVWIASSSVYHSAQVLAALDHGLHVFVEKTTSAPRHFAISAAGDQRYHHCGSGRVRHA